MNLLVAITVPTFCLLSLQGCSGIFGTGPFAKVNVDADVTVTDLSTNETVRIDTLADDTHIIRLPNGKRYALRVQNDTATWYVFMEPQRDPLTVLNVLNYGIGSIVDHVSRSYYSYDVEYITRPRNIKPLQNSRDYVEDSLRKRVTPVVPTAVMFDRPYALIAPYTSFGFEGPTNDRYFFGGLGGSVGIGIQIIPWIMPVYEQGGIRGLRIGDLRNSNAAWEAFGIHIQEPVLGLFASWKYGKMTAVGNAYEDPWHPTPPPDFKVNLTFYSLSFGIYGQWGRMEYRYRRNTSWNTHYLIPDLSGNYNGLYYTLHILL